MKNNNIIGLKDVAIRAGVSVPTVSRVINNGKYVTKKTKEKVMKAIKELNYEPMWVARSLRLGETNIIGVIIPEISNNFFANMVLAIEEYFRNIGKEIILLNTNNNEDIEAKAIRIAVSKRVGGIILATISKKNIFESNIPMVIVDNKIDIKNVDFVLHDDINSSFKLVNHLIKSHNKKKIACICGPLNESSGFEKLVGYKKALTENNIAINEEYIKIANWDIEQAYKATKELLSLKDRPEAIFTANTNMVIGSLRYINDNGFMVPDDVAVVTFDDYDFVSAFKPPLTTLKRVDTKIGNIAAEILNKRINGDNSPYREIRLDSELVLRKSCGCN